MSRQQIFRRARRVLRNSRKSFERPRARGAVAVEFALLAPVLLTLTLGVAEASRMLDIQNRLAAAARQGARLAAMEREGIVGAGASTNAKVEQDIRNFLAASGIPASAVGVAIAAAPTPLTDLPPVGQIDLDELSTLDLDDPANDLALFQIVIQLRYGDLCALPPPGLASIVLRSRFVCRNARSSIVQ